jgi:hypothetical protein
VPECKCTQHANLRSGRRQQGPAAAINPVPPGGHVPECKCTQHANLRSGRDKLCVCMSRRTGL